MIDPSTFFTNNRVDEPLGSVDLDEMVEEEEEKEENALKGERASARKNISAVALWYSGIVWTPNGREQLPDRANNEAVRFSPS